MDNLPVELLTGIAESLDSTALLSFRHTSRFLRDTVQKLFIRTFVQKRVHLDTIYSLKCLLAIVQDGTYGRLMRDITICVVSPKCHVYDTCSRQLAAKIIKHDDRGGYDPDLQMPPTYLEQFKEDSDDIQDPRLDLLTDVLRTLSAAGVSVSLTMEQDVVDLSPKSKQYGAVRLSKRVKAVDTLLPEHLTDDLGSNAYDPSAKNAENAFLLAVLAAARSAHPLQALHLSTEQTDAVSLLAFDAMQQLPAVTLRSIKSFSVAIDPSQGLPHETLGRSLARMTALRTCHLTFSNWQDEMDLIEEEDMIGIREWLQDLPLQTLTIESMVIGDGSDLQLILEPLNGSLRRLKLSSLDIWREDESQWPVVLSWVAERFELESFSMYHLGQMGRFVRVLDEEAEAEAEAQSVSEAIDRMDAEEGEATDGGVEDVRDDDYEFDEGIWRLGFKCKSSTELAEARHKMRIW